MQHAQGSDYRRAMPDATISEHGHNPSCGDDITLSLKVENGVIEKAAFEGHGCAISQASTSLMCELIEGESVEEAKAQVELFIGMIKGEINDDDLLEDRLGDAMALQSISVMPQRVKCAVLAWHTLDDILKGRSGMNQQG